MAKPKKQQEMENNIKQYKDFGKGILNTDGGAIQQGAWEPFSVARKAVTNSGIKDKEQLRKMG